MEADYQIFLERVYEECADPERQIEINPVRLALERFDEVFQSWVLYLFDLELMQQGGCLFAKNDLTPSEWKSLAVIKIWRTSRRGLKPTITAGEEANYDHKPLTPEA